MAKKMVFLYVGHMNSSTMYPEYPDSVLQGFSKATEFVLTHANYDGYYSNSTHLNTYQNELAKLTTRIKNLTGKKVWLGLPRVPAPTAEITMANYQNYASWLKNVCSSLKTKVDGYIGGTGGFNSNVNGFYMNDEHIRNKAAGDLGGFPLTYTNLTAHPQIYLYNNVGTYVRGTIGKQLMWAPYFGTGAYYATYIKDIQYVVNRTSIFDYVFLQPQYYFLKSDPIKFNLNVIRESIRDNQVHTRNASNQIVKDLTKTSVTKIGCQLEIDQNYFTGRSAGGTQDYGTPSDLQARYGEYTSCLSASLTNPSYSKANADFSYYTGAYYGNGGTGQKFTDLQSLINQFYT